MIDRAKPVDPKRQNERRDVELPLLEQLEHQHWRVLDLDRHQQPKDTGRSEFAQTVHEAELREALRTLNPWLEEDQVDGLVRHVTPSAPGSLLEANEHVLGLLTDGVPVDENRATAEKSPTARYLDFETPARNRFLAVCQLKLRIPGTEKHVFPDVVLFVNGLPLVVIECKSPKAKDGIAAAIDQMRRYAEARGAAGEGNRALFYPNQVLVATTRQRAVFGTITSRHEKHFFRWADPYPRTPEDLKQELKRAGIAVGQGGPNDQQRLVAGMLDRENLLSLVRTFTLFTESDRGQRIKVVGRYQQFRAVKKAVAKLLDGPNKAARSGIIWHTQGSGKSLTMVFLVREMYLHDDLRGWKVLFVTDRTQLEDQLRRTAQAIGKAVKPAASISRLKALLATDSSDLVMAMIHKFQERDLETSLFPELNVSPKVLVLTDEAHRSQYSRLGANLDRAIPNATEIAFTGTPIDKTEKKYGDYIDTYTMRQSVIDGVTLEIVYEGRTANAEVPDQEGADALFADVFSDYDLQERLDILGYASRDAYLEAEDVIRAKARDMVRHYTEHVLPNGFKAQVVATSREAAHRYGLALQTALAERVRELEAANPLHIPLDRLRRVQATVVISGGGHNDKPHLKAHADPAQHRRDIQSFKLAFGAEDEDGVRGDVGFLVVNNMLLTGFDAPIEQVLYLDRVIVAHNLLQAIARVNRVGGDGKDEGFVVDYVGVGHHLKRALDDYHEREQADVLAVLSDPARELAELKEARDAIWMLLEGAGVDDLHDYDAFFDYFYDEDARFEYVLAYRRFTSALNTVMPRKEALDFLEEYLQFAEINVQATQHLRDGRLSMKGIPEKLRRVTDAHLRARGIDQKVEPISILDEDFLSEVGRRTRAKTKAAAVEHALRHHLEEHFDEDPELYASFAEELERIIARFKDNWARIREELEKLRQRIRNAKREPTYGLHRKRQMPVFRILKRELFDGRPLTDDDVGALVALTKDVTALMERELTVSGFWRNVPAQNKLKGELQKALIGEPERVRQLPGLVKQRKPLVSRLMELAEKNHDVLLYA